MRPNALIMTAVLLFCLCLPAEGANILQVSVSADLWCLGQFQACGEIFSSSRFTELDPEHVGKNHLLTTRAWVCAGTPEWVDLDSQSQPAQVNFANFGYIQFSPISGTFQGVKGRATGGIPGVAVNFQFMPACEATVC